MNLTKINNINKTKKDTVLEIIREALISGEYKPGERIFQEKLAEELNISQTPIREALRVLEAEGIIEYSPHKGVRVSDLTIDEINEIYAIRMELELLAIRHAIVNITEEGISELRAMQKRIEKLAKEGKLEETYKPDYDFHMTIYSYCNMPELIKFIRILWTKLPRDILLSVPDGALKSADDYRDLLSALENRDVKRCELELKNHINRVWKSIDKYLNKDT